MGDVLQSAAGGLGPDFDEDEFAGRLIAEQLDRGGHHQFAKDRAKGRCGEEIRRLVLADPSEVTGVVASGRVIHRQLHIACERYARGRARLRGEDF